jgi:hypothetical protein
VDVSSAGAGIVELTRSPRLIWKALYRGGIAAALAFAVAAGSYLATGRHRQILSVPENGAARPQGPGDALREANVASTVASLSAQLAAQTKTTGVLEAELEDAEEKLAAAHSAAAADAKGRANLQRQIDAGRQQLVASQQQDVTTEQTIADLQAKISLLQTRARAQASDAALDQLKIRNLSAQVSDLNGALDRQRDMLGAGRDLRDMMAARNLHIIDVVDTDPKGKNRAAFGRIFFAENRQLVFYAYDLNEKRLEDARFDYRIWGQKEGQPRTARSLGVFYADDKTQHRWVFKCEDPKMLSEIDSLFVTLEPVSGDAARPRGQQLMYAYLRGQPNHP